MCAIRREPEVLLRGSFDDGHVADGMDPVKRALFRLSGPDSAPRCGTLADFRPRTPFLANRSSDYLLGSYRIATAPEPNSSRLTSFKLRGFDSPANNVGPWPASLGCTTNS